jgi:hypothetical protein
MFLEKEVINYLCWTNANCYDSPQSKVGYTAFLEQEDYLLETTAMLDAQPADAFQPDLAQLDNLIASLTVPPPVP